MNPEILRRYLVIAVPTNAEALHNTSSSMTIIVSFDTLGCWAPTDMTYPTTPYSSDKSLPATFFAVLWEPEGEIYAFSGPQLLGAVCDPDVDPREEYDVNSISSSDASFYNEDSHDHFYVIPCPIGEKKGYMQTDTRTSSTLGGLDVYLRGSMFPLVHAIPREYEFLDSWRKEFDFDTRTSFFMCSSLRQEVYKGSKIFEASDVSQHEPILRSRFSTTTTSTSNYISVEHDAISEIGSCAWSNLEAPHTPGFTSNSMFLSQQLGVTRRLRKVRPGADASFQSHKHDDVACAGFRDVGIGTFMRRLGLLKSKDGLSDWVWVDAKC